MPVCIPRESEAVTSLVLSAEGAEYSSQGQAPSERGASPLDKIADNFEALKERNNCD